MSETKLTLQLLEDKFGVCRLNYQDKIPDFAINSEFYSITGTKDELSVVCLQKDIPEGLRCEPDWRIFKIEGVLDFSLIGILSSISSVLAKEGISIFAVSTYDTDYILVKDKDIDHAIKALLADNYQINHKLKHTVK
jgi:Uncharacterized conserved protein